MRRIERATERLARSRHATPGLAEALQARHALLGGDIELAFKLIDPWSRKEPRGIVPVFVVARARAVLARAVGDAAGYLEHTSMLVEEVAPNELMRHHRTQIMLLHIDALTQSGRVEEALATQRDLVDYEIQLGKLRASAMFDWMQIRVDVDLQFAHYADVVRVPEAVLADNSST